MIITILGGYLVGVFAAVVKPCVPWKQWLGKTPTSKEDCESPRYSV